MDTVAHTNQLISTFPPLVVRILPREYRVSPRNTATILAQFESLRERISAAWKPGVSIVEEIRLQRTKLYEVRS